MYQQQKSLCVLDLVRNTTQNAPVLQRLMAMPWTKLVCAAIWAYFFLSGRILKCNFANAKATFYRSFNSMFSKVCQVASIELIFHLTQTKCVPSLLFGLDACPIYAADCKSLERFLTNIFMKLFFTISADEISDCQLFFVFRSMKQSGTIRSN